MSARTRPRSTLLARSVTWLASSALAALLLAPAASASAATIEPRIVHGKAATIQQAPFQVALLDPREVDPKEPSNVHDAQFCGGVIRDATHVITAAHCVTFGGPEAVPPADIEVLAGAENTETPGAGSIRDPVIATSVDPEWNPRTGDQDLGILTLANRLWPEGETPTIDGLRKIAPIRFGSASEAGEGGKATVSGWGLTTELKPEQKLTEKEEQEGHPAQLQSGEVSFVSRGACSKDYEAQGVGPIGESLLCAIGATPPIVDACFGDSGGPLFSVPPGLGEEDRLLGTVDFGVGCAQAEFPGVYQSLVAPVNVAFASSDPPQAPLNQTPPTIAGTAQPGQTVTCNPGSWLGAPEFLYRFVRDESTILRPLAEKALTPGFSTSAAYAVQGGDVGTRIFCKVFAHNAGGVGEATGEDVTVSAAPPAPAVPPPTPSPAPPPKPPPAPPTLRVVSEACRRTTCTINVRASNGVGDAAVTAVEARLSYRRRVPCRKHGKRATCLKTIRHRFTAKPTPRGHFLIVVSSLRPGSYKLALTAIDKAGIRQTQPTTVALLVKAPPRRR